MTGKELVNEIRELIIANEFLGEGDEDINNKIIDLLKDNLKSLVEIDEERIWRALKHWFPNAEYLTGIAEAIAKDEPIKLKEE